MDTSERDSPFLPSKSSVQLFSLLWQLEAWMREMVYVEFRARYATWQNEITNTIRDWPPRSQNPDKRLTHMRTPHERGISYLSLGQLLSIVQSETYSMLFTQYLPPPDIFGPRMSEISQIRHRIAHFRDPHDTDVDRTSLLLKDLDQGFWRFATAYQTRKIRFGDNSSDSINDYFNDTHDRRWVVEMRTLDGDWRYAGERREPRLNFDLSYSTRPWFTYNAQALIGHAGLVYHARLRSRLNVSVDEVLRRTQDVHANCIHIRLEHNSIEIMVPSVIGHDLVVSTLDSFLNRSIECMSSSDVLDTQKLDQIAAKWPEYVLGPSNPLGALETSMQGPIFALS
jgi:hypothetical protein|nr:hypothetical protein [Kofleriaceae bacterium]